MSDLFDSLFDDAAIFPPGNAPMPAAVRAHRAHRKASHAHTVGSFLCSDARWAELSAVLDDDDAPPLPLRIVARGPNSVAQRAIETAARDSRVELRGVEVPAPDVDVLAQTVRFAQATMLDAGSDVFVELPLAAGPGALQQLAQVGVSAKFRTGGATAAAFPSERALAAAIGSALSAGVPFKLTAGLHHAVRHREAATGFEHHGFLNVLAAVGAGTAGADVDDMCAILTERSPEPLVLAVTAADAGKVRRSFRSIGTCSIDDPVTDLRHLGLLPAGAS